MSNLTSVHITAGVPDIGTGTVSTLDNLVNLTIPVSLAAAPTTPITAASLPLPTGASSSSNQTNASQKTQIVDGSGAVISSTTNALDVYTTARSLLYNAGINGFIISPLTLTSGADLASLASGGAATLTGGGSSGVSNQTNTGNAQYGYLYFQTVTAGFTPTAGGNISIWFLFSPDGGTTYETTPATASTTVFALPRPPDCIIPLDVAALGTSAVKVSQRILLPEGSFKVVVQNNSGAAFGAGNYTLKLVSAARNN